MANIPIKDYLLSHAKTRDGRPPKTAWLVAPPKSGSTWSSVLLGWSFLWQRTSLLPRGHARRAQEIIVPPDFDRNVENVFIPHHHSQATEPTIEFALAYDVSMIVQTRNIFDMTVSLIDHLTNDGIGVPIAYVPTSFRKEPFNTRAEIVTTLLMPWYISFFASWAYAAVDNKVRVHYLEYESLLRDPIPALAACLTHAGEMRNINVYNRALKQGAHREQTRFNKGIPGRGRAQLPSHCITELTRMVQLHSDATIATQLKRILNQYEQKESTRLEQTTDSRPEVSLERMAEPSRLHRGALATNPQESRTESQT